MHGTKSSGVVYTEKSENCFEIKLNANILFSRIWKVNLYYIIQTVRWPVSNILYIISHALNLWCFKLNMKHGCNLFILRRRHYVHPQLLQDVGSDTKLSAWCTSMDSANKLSSWADPIPCWWNFRPCELCTLGRRKESAAFDEKSVIQNLFI